MDSGFTRACLAVAAVVSWGPGAAAAAAQSTPWTAGAGVEAQVFSFTEGEKAGVESLTLITVPIAANVALGRRVTARLAGYWAQGSIKDAGGRTSSVSGLTDTELTATVTLGEGNAAITGVALLPTGSSTHTLEEAGVAGLVASDLLPFRISNWGTGGGFGLRALGTRRIGNMGAGLSVGYFVAGQFNPVADEDVVYRPGNNLEVRAALDGNVGRAGKLSLELSFRSFSDDATDELNLYRSGNRLQGIGSYAFAVGRRSSAVIYAGAMHRAGGAYQVPDVPLLAAGPQTLFMAGAGARVRVRGALVLPALDLRVLRSEDGIDQGVASRVGVAAEFRTRSGWTLVPVVRLHLGGIQVVQDVESTFLGADLGLTVRVGRSGR